MALNYAAKFVAPGADETKSHVLAYTVARSAATSLLFDLWNGATSAARKFGVDLNGKPVSAAYTAGDLLFAATGVIAGVRRIDGLSIGAVNSVCVSTGSAPSWATTLAGLTLTNPTINAAALSGTLTGTPTWASTQTMNVTGNVSGSSGSCTGAVATATALATARAINGVNFDGTAAITVTAAAGTLTGTTLNATVVTSSLTSVGTLEGLTVTAAPTFSAMTATRVLFAGTAGLLSDSASLTYVAGTGTLTATTFVGALTGTASGTAGQISTHAALTTGIHGLAITAGQTLTVTTGGTIGSAAYTAATAYDASGAAATVQSNLGTHAGLTTTAHGLGASAFHADAYFALSGHNHSGVYDPAGSAAAVTPTSLGLVIGTNVQAYNANLTAINQALTSTSSPSFTAVTTNVTGNCSGSSATCSGLAASATVLATARAINGVNFNGSAAITVTAAAGTLTGTTLNATVVTSSLTAIGTLVGGAVPASLVTAGSFPSGAFDFTTSIRSPAFLGAGGVATGGAIRLATNTGIYWRNATNTSNLGLSYEGSVAGQFDLGGPLNLSGEDDVLKIAGKQVMRSQGAAVADATDAASTMARLNDLLARVRVHGLIAT